MSESLGHKAVSGAIWAAIDRVGSMILQFVVNLVLARLLTPSDFGAIGMLTIFIAVSMTLVDGGFASALIQRKESDQTDFSTIFYWNVGVSVLFYGIIFLISPWIATFYKMDQLSNILKVLGLMIILNGILSVQIAKLQKDIQFKSLAAVNIVSYGLGAILGIIMAFTGYGVWSLVGLNLFSTFTKIIIFYIITRWHPSLVFSCESFKRLFSFGGYLLCANLLQTGCQNAQGLIIGKQFSAGQLGFYTQADKLNAVTSDSLPRIIIQVMYPIYSQLQDQREKLVNTVLMNLRVVAFIIFPLLSCLILTAEPIIAFLYGEKWLPAAPFFQILCVGGICTCLTNINYYAVAAVGQSKALFWWSFYKWGVLLALLIGTSFISMKALVWGITISHFNIFMVNTLLSRKYVGIGLRKVAQSLLPIILLSTSLFIGIHLIESIIVSINWIITIIFFLFLYFALSYILRIQAFCEMKELLKRLKPEK